MHNTPSVWKPAAIGGLSFGVLGGLPVVQYLNCLCCVLVIGAGFLAAYLYSRACQQAGVEFGPGNGAMTGLAAAPFYALASSLIGGLVFAAVGAESFQESIDEAMRQVEGSGGDAQMVERIGQFLENTGPFVLILLGFGFTLLLALVFSTVGGVIGGATFKHVPPRPAPPSAGFGPPPSSGAPPPLGV
jgi:hypothetical protein